MSKDEIGLAVFTPAFAAIGKLTTNWARMETALFAAFDGLVGNRSDVGIRGRRWDDAVRTFRSVAAGMGAGEAALAELDDIRAEAARVKPIRNIAVHRPLHLQQGDSAGPDIVVFELHGPSKRRAPPEIKFTVTEIEQCADHVFRLAFRIREPLVLMLKDPNAQPYGDPGFAGVRDKALLPAISRERVRRGAGGGGRG